MGVPMKLAALAAASASLFAGSVASAATFGYAISEGRGLIAFDVTNPAGATLIALTDGAGRPVNLDAIDFRPATGELFGYSNSSGGYFTVNVATGVVTPFPVSGGATVAPTNSPNVDIDWNPTIDRMRTVSAADDNIVFNPTTGGAAAQTALFYQAGDPNLGVDPFVSGNAYTNNFAGAMTTQQYVLDYNLNVIATLGNNAGTIGALGGLTLGGSPVDFDANLGFDIATIAGNNVFYAILSQGGLSALFTIDIMTRELTQLGVFAANLGEIDGLAIAPVPLPAGLLLFLTGALGLGAARRRKGRA